MLKVHQRDFMEISGKLFYAQNKVKFQCQNENFDQYVRYATIFTSKGHLKIRLMDLYEEGMKSL